MGGAPAWNATGTYDTSSCTGGTVVSQTGGAPDLCVRSVSTFGVSGTVRITGSRPLVVVASEAVTIDGTIDVSARITVAGPGGGGAFHCGRYEG